MIEIRGRAEVVDAGGKAIFGDNFDDVVVRIHPSRIITFGIDEGETGVAGRDVGTV
jgi:hypothetical protein